MIGANVSHLELVHLEMRRQIAKLETRVAHYRQQVAAQEERLADETEQRLLAKALHRAGIVLGSTLNYEEVLDRILEQVEPHDDLTIVVVQM